MSRTRYGLVMRPAVACPRGACREVSALDQATRPTPSAALALGSCLSKLGELPCSLRSSRPPARRYGGAVNPIDVELVYFDGCPSWETAWSELGRAIAATRVRVDLRLVNLEDLPADRQHGFAGSPTIRIDGCDLEGYDGEPVLACRRYEANEGRGWPSPEQLRTALVIANRAANAN